MSVEFLNDVAGSAIKKVLHGVSEALREEAGAAISVADTTADVAPQLVEASFTTPSAGTDTYGTSGEATPAAEVCPDVTVVEDSVTIEPGCSGVIEGLKEWAENTTAGPDTYPEGSIPDRLIEAKLNGTLSKEADAIAREQGLFRPGETKDSFNLWADSQIRMSQDGGLQIVNPNGGVAYTLWDQCDQSAYTGSRMIPTGPCGTEPIVESLPPPPPPEVVYEPAPEPEVVAEAPAPEVAPTPEPEVVPVSDTTVWYQDRIFVWCPDMVVAEVFMVDTTGLSVEESAEKAREVAASLPNDYQSNIPADKRFVLIRVLDENGEETEKLKCLTIGTGEVSNYNPNVSGYGPQTVRAGDAWGYVTGRDGINDGSPYGNGPDVVHPHPLARYEVVDANGDGTIDGLKEVVRPLENAVWVQVQFIGESIFGPEWMLKEENRAVWEKLMALEIPDRMFGDVPADEQVRMLRSYVRSELGYRMSKDEAERMVIWMNEYSSEADTSFLKFDYANQGYTSARASGTFGNFFKTAAEEAARRGELGPVSIRKS